MKPPLFVRPLTGEERQHLQASLRSPDAFALRRGQLLLASAAGRQPSWIAAALGCATQTVRDAIRAFHEEGVACVQAKSKAPKTVHGIWSKDRDGELKAL